jgi:hypothetical protein
VPKNNGLRLYPLNLMPVMRPKGGRSFWKFFPG